MQIEDAIKHAWEKAVEVGGCGTEHGQLAQWLEELVSARTQIKQMKGNVEAVRSMKKYSPCRYSDGDPQMIADKRNGEWVRRIDAVIILGRRGD